MRAGAVRILGTLVTAWLAAWRVPGKYKLLFLLKPLDATRFLEFAYLLDFLDHEGPAPGSVLDVSSPVLLSHILARRGHQVTKADINPSEMKYVGDSGNPVFEVQDATQLSREDASFDLVVSVSVIEHIYERYGAAINEMARVAKPGGYLYLTFPVAGEHREEWIGSDPYGSQVRDGQRVFFQYRFGPMHYRQLRESLPEKVELVAEDIRWESRDGLYDKLVGRLRQAPASRILAYARSAALNLLAGPRFFEAEPGSFEHPRSFGNAQWILRVKEGKAGA